MVFLIKKRVESVKMIKADVKNEERRAFIKYLFHKVADLLKRNSSAGAFL